jgi:hypothetical protein
VEEARQSRRHGPGGCRHHEFDPMKDLTSPTAIKVKGILFLLVGLLSAALLICEHPSWKVAVLLVVSIWCFCRFYYFAFYVIEKYVDPGYRFSGLFSFMKYLMTKRRGGR